MNNRENTMAVLTYRDYTRIPVVSFGYWAETVMKWADEGHIGREEAINYVEDDSTLIPKLKVSEVPALVKSGIISGGMIPKVDCCVEAVRQGAPCDLIFQSIAGSQKGNEAFGLDGKLIEEARQLALRQGNAEEIGRASCRERV